MIKLCHFPAISSDGQQNIELFHDPDQLHHSYLDKLAAPYLPEVREYLDRIKPDPENIYGLINALGAYEYWSSNCNGDAFEEEHLIHKGPIWGYETFVHYAYPYMHHRNGDPNRAFGSVEKSCWNPYMKRVELVVRINRKLSAEHGAQSVVDKIDRGELPSTSMGAKIPYDLSSITTDWGTYRHALATFDPMRHRHPGVAVLQYHKMVKPIKGLAITRKDYDEYCRTQLNRILPDGRKVFVFNPFPRFFDISFVFIGAEITSRMMAKLAGMTTAYSKNILYAPVKEPVQGLEKTASISSIRDFFREKRAAAEKAAAMVKDVPPIPEASKLIPLIQRERDFPPDVLDDLSHHSVGNILASSGSLGIRIRPREFQRIILIRMGEAPLADALDREGKTFCPVCHHERNPDFGAEHIIPELVQKLIPFLDNRSCLPPVVSRRVLKISVTPVGPDSEPVERNSPLLEKIASLYNGYQLNFMDKLVALNEKVCSDVSTLEAIHGIDESSFFDRTASPITPVSPLTTLGVSIPAAYLVAHLAKMEEKRKLYSGERPGALTQLIAQNPNLFAALIGLGALKASGSSFPDKLLHSAKAVANNLMR